MYYGKYDPYLLLLVQLQWFITTYLLSLSSLYYKMFLINLPKAQFLLKAFIIAF